MIPAMTIDYVENEVKRRKTSKVIGLLLAPYNREYVKKIVDQYYNEWNSLSDDKFDLYWLSYGYYADLENSKQIVLELIGGNQMNIYFDINNFIHELDNLHLRIKCNLKPKFELILVDSFQGKIKYRDRYRIDLESDLSANDRILNNVIMGVISSAKEHQSIQDIKKRTKRLLRKERLHRVKISDLISLFGILNM